MKAKVLRLYKDKKTNELVKPGQTITVSKERFEEINSTSHGLFLSEIEEEKVEETKPKRKRKTTKKSE